MRGMKKWLPFKSLSGQYEVLAEHEKRRKRVAKPELSPEEQEEINEVIVSLKRGDVVFVSYYREGNIYRKEQRTYLSCDEVSRSLSFREGVISFASLLALEPKNDLRY